MDFRTYIVALAEIAGLLIVLTPLIFALVRSAMRAKYQARMEYMGKVLAAIGAAAEKTAKDIREKNTAKNEED